mmetsp:Transcript_8372/g.21546  ORF Transcript_8372/g.21546 Transcript_8372/m.21546 type:complete len:354 (-) Transcript_8372:1827-2888(-)
MEKKTRRRKGHGRRGRRAPDTQQTEAAPCAQGKKQPDTRGGRRRKEDEGCAAARHPDHLKSAVGADSARSRHRPGPSQAPPSSHAYLTTRGRRRPVSGPCSSSAAELTGLAGWLDAAATAAGRGGGPPKAASLPGASLPGPSSSAAASSFSFSSSGLAADGAAGSAPALAAAPSFCRGATAGLWRHLGSWWMAAGMSASAGRSAATDADADDDDDVRSGGCTAASGSAAERPAPPRHADPQRCSSSSSGARPSRPGAASPSLARRSQTSSARLCHARSDRSPSSSRSAGPMRRIMLSISVVTTPSTASRRTSAVVRRKGCSSSSGSEGRRRGSRCKQRLMTSSSCAFTVAEWW